MIFWYTDYTWCTRETSANAYQNESDVARTDGKNVYLMEALIESKFCERVW